MRFSKKLMNIVCIVMEVVFAALIALVLYAIIERFQWYALYDVLSFSEAKSTLIMYIAFLILLLILFGVTILLHIIVLKHKSAEEEQVKREKTKARKQKRIETLQAELDALKNDDGELPEN